VTGWRFSDREWFKNERLNLRAEANRGLVADELVDGNVVFGPHRWFAGGGSPALIALTTIEEWDEEVARGRPGDNLILLSLRKVAGLAVVHTGEPTSSRPGTLQPADIAAVEHYDRSAAFGELLCVRRSAPTPGKPEAALRVIDLRDAGWPWQEQVAEAASGGGEVWLFDGELAWRDHERRQQGSEPPEEWTAHHGLCLVDGYLPDAQGRVVCGGPY